MLSLHSITPICQPVKSASKGYQITWQMPYHSISQYICQPVACIKRLAHYPTDSLPFDISIVNLSICHLLQKLHTSTNVLHSWHCHNMSTCRYMNRCVLFMPLPQYISMCHSVIGIKRISHNPIDSPPLHKMYIS